MKFETLMVIKAVVCLVFGIGLLVIPGVIFLILGVDLGAGGAFPAREYGSALFGILMLTWFARKAPQSTARTAIILALFVYDALGFIATLIARIAGVLNPLGWLIAFIYLFFALGFGYFLAAKPAIAEETTAQ
jgi:hypothetical protein